MGLAPSIRPGPGGRETERFLDAMPTHGLGAIPRLILLVPTPWEMRTTGVGAYVGRSPKWRVSF
eukprot:15440925-Alexandrium_andersonii.AAC.1